MPELFHRKLERSAIGFVLAELPRSSVGHDRISYVVDAAGSMPGDLHKLWRTRNPKGYHMEYGFSTMGYEIAGGLGAKLAAPERVVADQQPRALRWGPVGGRDRAARARNAPRRQPASQTRPGLRAGAG